MKKEKVITEDFKLYENGKSYNLKLDPPYYDTIDMNERFYAGDQWRGVDAKGLPTPVFNIFKRITNYYVSSVMAQRPSVQYSSDDVDGDPVVAAHADIMNAVQKRIFENNKMDSLLREGLFDAALSGDSCLYAWFDNEIDSGNSVKGDIVWEQVDGVNTFFGNPNDTRVNFMGKPIQPYIILSFREMVDDLKEEAKKNGIKQNIIDNIAPDLDNNYEAGDRGKVELDNVDENGKARVILKFFPKTVNGVKTIWCRKSTKSATIKEEFDTMSPIYPIAWMNWDKRKNSYHGQAPGTGLVPNQIYVNKQFAAVQIYTMRMAFPKLIYDKSRMSPPSNRVGEAIGIDTASGGSVYDVASYLQPGQMSGQVMGVIDSVFNYTKETMGATDAVMGDVNPENTSAIIATIEQSVVPLENIKARLYQFVEDIGNINNAMMAAHYGKRKMLVSVDGKKVPVEFDFGGLKKMRYAIRADVGPGSYMSEAATVKTLDNLLGNNRINMKQYLERMPQGYIKDIQSLIEDVKTEMEMAKQQAQMMAQQAQQPMQ